MCILKSNSRRNQQKEHDQQKGHSDALIEGELIVKRCVKSQRNEQSDQVKSVKSPAIPSIDNKAGSLHSTAFKVCMTFICVKVRF